MTSSKAVKHGNSKLPSLLKRSDDLQRLLHFNILQSQQTDSSGALADTLLICNGGTIRTHSFLLQGASPFIWSAIMSQGENYPFIREVLLPDFSVKEVEHVITLIYKGYVEVYSKQELRDLQENLKFFQIAGVEASSMKIKGDKDIGDSIKIQELNRIPQDIFKIEGVEGRKPKLEETDDKHGTEPSGPVVQEGKSSKTGSQKEIGVKPIRRSGRAQKPISKLGKPTDAEADGDDDYQPNSEQELNGANELRSDEQVLRKRKTPTNKKLSIRLERLPASATASPKTGNQSAAPTPPKIMNSNVGVATTPEAEEESDTDSEDEDWVAPNYKDKAWFTNESLRCQGCSKTFDKPAQASLCTTSHKSLRCYFCFNIFSTTDILFKHFRRRHKQAGRESTLICPFCDMAVPYKSVSCHVISVHLRTSKPDEEDEESDTKHMVTNRGKPMTPSRNTNKIKRRSRSTSTDRVPSSERPAGKKLKSECPQQTNGGQKKKVKVKSSKKKKDLSLELPPLKVPDLDVTVEKVMASGRVLTFRLRKKRTTVAVLTE